MPTWISPDHSERVATPCDVGSPKTQLAARCPFAANWGGWAELAEDWPHTQQSDADWQRTRLPAFLEWLWARPEERIVVVGHGAFFQGLTKELGVERYLDNCETMVLKLGRF